MSKNLLLVTSLFLTGCSSVSDLEWHKIIDNPDGRPKEVLQKESLGSAHISLDKCSKIHYRGEAVDYWQTPTETLERRQGDCEDFALCYFYALKAQGKHPYIIISLGETTHAYVLDGDTVYDNGKEYDADMHMIRYKPTYKLSAEAVYQVTIK